LQGRAWKTLLVASAVSLFLSVLSDSWTNTMLTGVYLLLIKFPGKVALYAIPVTCFCLWFIIDAVNSSYYVYIYLLYFPNGRYIDYLSLTYATNKNKILKFHHKCHKFDVYIASNNLEIMWKERETIQCEALTQH